MATAILNIPVRQLLLKNKHFLLYSASLGLLLFLLRWMELRFLIFDHAVDIYIGCIALLFTALGIWLATKLSARKKETVVIEKMVFVPQPAAFEINEKNVQDLQISKRELEVLQLMAEGLSNNEIAERLFLSLPTIKTHSSKLFEKLEVKRRTQAVEAGRRLQLIR